MRNPAILTAKVDTDILKSIISKHDITNPIQSALLEKEFDCSGPAIRNSVRELRREGTPIASCWDGYFLAKSTSEIEGTINNLRERSNSLEETASKLEHAF